MLSQPLAQRLKEMGLVWTPARHDFFCVPERGLDDHVFVISDMTVAVEFFHGSPAITFNGAVEWSLDFILTVDALWMPTESQLRERLQEYLLAEAQPAVQLHCSADGYRCVIHFWGETIEFFAFNASDAYAQALLYVLHNQPVVQNRALLA